MRADESPKFRIQPIRDSNEASWHSTIRFQGRLVIRVITYFHSFDQYLREASSGVIKKLSAKPAVNGPARRIWSPGLQNCGNFFHEEHCYTEK